MSICDIEELRLHDRIVRSEGSGGLRGPRTTWRKGGFVESGNGVWRVLGSLAVSRGIGDHYLKQWVTAEPETKVLKLEPEHEFLLLASDGLWDKVSNQEAIDVARPLCVNIDKPKPLSACRKLVDLSVSRGSTYDISVMLIQLGRFF
ncbi:hypothetical protein OROGR_015299 [Orobanche gracilis]